MRVELLLVALYLMLGVVDGVSILRLEVPKVVEANSSAVVLDCEYQVQEWERHGLVVKWYMDKINLVYQWIPQLHPQALGVLSGRVDTSYRASTDPWAVHRAVYILRPDPSLSGQYSCSVSTFEDEDARSGALLVWHAPRSLDLRYWRPSEHLVNVTCTARGVAPQPVFTLYTHNNITRQEIPIRGQMGLADEDGVWAAGAWGLIVWAETEPDTVIGCTLALPGTTHTTTQETVYHPDLPIITTTTTTTTTTTSTTTTTPASNTNTRPSEGLQRLWPNNSQNLTASTGFLANRGELSTIHCHFTIILGPE